MANFAGTCTSDNKGLLLLMLCLFSAIAYYKRALYYLNVVFNLMFNGVFFW